MRYISLTREKKINGAWAPYYVIIDGYNCGVVNNGVTINIPIDYDEHNLKICADMGDGKHRSKGYIVNSGNKNLHYTIRTKIHLLSVEIYY